VKVIPFTQLASTNGDGTGTSNFIGDYSSVAVEGYIKADAGEDWEVYRVIIRVGDASGMQAAQYGNLGSALTNGIRIRVYTEDTNEVADLDGGSPVKSNAGWAALCYDADVKSWRTGGAGDELLVARYTFSRLGAPITLSGDDRIQFDFSDDFTGLINHTFIFQGSKIQL
jgi:hypothetical protein